MKKSRLLSTLCACIISVITYSPHAALVNNGGGLIYDTVLDITWAQPDNTPRTNSEANTWVAGLTLGGVSGWRLPYLSVVEGLGPTVSPIDCSTASELDCRDNELGYMFYWNLGGAFGQSIENSSDPDLELFPMLDYYGIYWSGTEYDTTRVWGFAFINGDQNFGDKTFSSLFSWAVHEGNVGVAAPIPATVWLFGSGLLGLIGISRRNRSA